MIEFAWPWMFLLLPVPLVVWWLLPAYRERQVSIQIPFFADVVEATGETPHDGAVVLSRRPLQMVGAVLIWGLLVTAAARPEWVGDPVHHDVSARDLMLAVDISGSMQQQDFKASNGAVLQRLDGVKAVIGDFVARRRGDRVGLIVFGTRAYVQVPFTQDIVTARELLDQTQVGMAGEQTVIGDAIGLAIKTFEASQAPQKLVILLTDGNDTGSKVPPAHAADIAQQRSVTIYTIGVGDPEASGDYRVDLATLREVAARTQGQFFRAEDGAQLEAIYADIDRLAPVKLQSFTWRPRVPMFQWPLGASVVIALVLWTVLLITRGHALARTARHA